MCDECGELTPEEREEQERKVKEWEIAHPDVLCNSTFLHPYFWEKLLDLLAAKVRWEDKA
jgi:hypothetical protein